MCKIKYKLQCIRCNWQTTIDNNTIYCPRCASKSFLRTVFNSSKIELNGPEEYFYSYQNILPFQTKFHENGPRIGFVKSNTFNKAIGLNNLWLILSCYAPHLGSSFMSATFKELEALGVVARTIEQTNKTLIVSSAGNAARSFLEICSEKSIPAIIVVPSLAADSLFVRPITGITKPLLLSVQDSYYPDAIKLVGKIVSAFPEKLTREYGCYNIARRDAIGILIHRAVKLLNQIPKHYVQAVGSGTGGIAAWEANLRIIEDGQLGSTKMKLHLAQNYPFTPMVDAWNSNKRHISRISNASLRQMLAETYANTLSNSTPPYAVTGGVFDALSDTDGKMYSVTNNEAKKAKRLFEKHVSVKILPESSIAIAALLKAVKNKAIKQDELTVLHITGGGWKDSIKDQKKIKYPVGKHIKRKISAGTLKHVENYLNNL